MAWLRVWRGVARLGEARNSGLGEAGSCKVWCGMAWRGSEIKARHGMAWPVVAGPGVVRPGEAGHVTVEETRRDRMTIHCTHLQGGFLRPPCTECCPGMFPPLGCLGQRCLQDQAAGVLPVCHLPQVGAPAEEPTPGSLVGTLGDALAAQCWYNRGLWQV